MHSLRGLVCLALFAPLFAAGCGSSEPTGPKENLNDKDKQQIEELNEQRQDEWKTTPKSR
jgi:PBP1b-binding outer membrane lipoprotein LpoB